MAPQGYEGQKGRVDRKEGGVGCNGRRGQGVCGGGGGGGDVKGMCPAGVGGGGGGEEGGGVMKERVAGGGFAVEKCRWLGGSRRHVPRTTDGWKGVVVVVGGGGGAQVWIARE